MTAVTEPRVARILVIKWSALGDMAMATAVFEDIARAYPQATIHLNTLPNLAGLFEHDPRFAEVWAFDMRARGKRLSPVAQAFITFIRSERALIEQLAQRFSAAPTAQG